MMDSHSRRTFLQKTGVLGVGAALGALDPRRLHAAEKSPGAPNAEKIGWRVGVQIYTFRRFTLFESIDMVASLGLKWIESYAWQWISGEDRTAFDSRTPPELRAKVKAKLAEAGVTLTSHYEVAPFPRLFEFARDMGMEMVISDPGDGAFGYHFDAVDQLCEEYGITIALTNHPKPAAYWSPDEVLKVCEGRSPRIAASGDIGHWMREGFIPLECVERLGDRLVEFHFRDRDRKGPDGRDVPLGTGTADVKGILAEIYRHKRTPLFSLEYETNEQDPLPQLVESIKYLDKVAAELATTG